MADLETYAAENPVRFDMLKAACETLATADEPITLDSLSAALAEAGAPDFAIDDFDPWREIAGQVRQAIGSGSLAADTAAPAFQKDGTPVTPAPEPDPASRESLMARKVELDEQAHRLRCDVVRHTALRAQARHVFADTLQEYLTGLPKVTPESAARAFIANQIEERKAGRGGGQTPVAGPSRLDRRKTYSVGSAIGDGSEHAERNMRVGSHRGRVSANGPAVQSFPASMRGVNVRRG